MYLSGDIFGAVGQGTVHKHHREPSRKGRCTIAWLVLAIRPTFETLFEDTSNELTALRFDMKQLDPNPGFAVV